MNYQENKPIKMSVLVSFIASFVAVFFLLVLSVNQVQANSEIIFQPAGGLNDGTDEGSVFKGKDTYISSTSYDELDPGARAELWFTYYSGYDGYPLLKFDVSTLPSDITSAKLYLYVTANCGSGSCPNMNWTVNAVTSPWNEMTTTWNNRPTLDGSYGTFNIPSSPSAFNESGHDHWVSVDITDLYNGWKNGTITNYGIGFTRLGSTWDGGVWFNKVASSDYETASLRPKLVVQSVSPLNKTVRIDMRPYGQSNEINVKNNNGKVWVAVLSEIGFDAPNQINQTSLRFGHAGTETSFVSCKKDYNDVNKDNLPDLVCNFSTQLANFQTGDKIGKLTGKTINGVAINGEDTIRTVPAK